ncbi:MAG: O-antigen ligase family protein, partial [Promethearchaeota archaeon]
FIILVIGIMAIIALGLVNVRFQFYAWVVTIPFAQWSLYELGFMNLYMHRIILIFLLLFSLVYVSIRKITFLKISVVELLMLGFTLICLVSASKSNSLDRIGFAVLLNSYIFPFLGYYLARNFIQNDKDVRSFSVVITYLGLYLAYVGICEQLYPDLVFPRYIVNPKYIISGLGRSVGPSLEPVGYGIGLLFCLLFSTYLFFKINNSLNPKKILALIVILMAPIAIFFTVTRAVWGGLIFSLFILFLFFPRGKKMFAILFLILIIGFILIQTIQVSKTQGSAKDVLYRDTIYFRISMAKTGMLMFLEKPIFGFGQFQYSKEFTPYFERLGTSSHPTEGFLMHNTFINILVELGIIGFVPFFLIFAYLIKDAIILYRKSVENRDIAIIFLAACAAFIFAGMANNMHYKFANVLLFSMAGMTKGLLQGKTFYQKRTTLKSKAAFT